MTSKYLLVAAYIAFALLKLERRFLIGLISGAISLSAVMTFITPPDIILAWLHSLQLSESFHFAPNIVHNLTIFASLPALLLQYAPSAYRPLAKALVYFGVLIICIFSIFVCWKIGESKNLSIEKKTNIIFALAFYLMPILQPHLLYYDLSLMMAANILLWHNDFSVSSQKTIRALLIASVVVVDLYFVLFAVVGSSLIQPLAFVLMLFVLVFQILVSVRKAVISLEQTTALDDVG